MGKSRYKPMLLILRCTEVAIPFGTEDAQQRLPFFTAIATTAEVRFDFWQKVTQACTRRNFLREALQLATAGLAIHLAILMAHEYMIDQFT
ncbi:MAG: hypothetical protein ABI970_23085 [Chloroflexota bacterium]